jgi:hypothetical protein
MLRCEECECVTKDAWGWIAKVVDVDEEAPAEAPYTTVYCPVCAEREFLTKTARSLAYT